MTGTMEGRTRTDLGKALELANKLMAQGQLERSEAICQQAADQLPDHPGVIGLQANLALRRNDLEGARVQFERLTELNPASGMAYANAAEISRRIGDLDRAKEMIALARQRSPNDPSVLGNESAILFDCEDNEGALAAAQAGLGVDPKRGSLHNNAGNALQKLGRGDDAVAAFKKAVDLEPQNASFRANLGAALRSSGDDAAAIEAFRESLRAAPNNATALADMALALCEQGRAAEALGAITRAFAAEPDSARVHAVAASVFQKLGQSGRAEAAARRAMELDPEAENVHNTLGQALVDQDEIAKAINVFNEGLKKNPDEQAILNNRGNALKLQGDIKGARKSLEKAIELDPDDPAPYVNLVDTGKIKPGDPIIEKLEGALARSGGQHAKAMEFMFALGKAYDDIGEANRAFEYLSTANGRKRDQIKDYSVEADDKVFAAIKANITRSWINERISTDTSGKRPILILGMPRSGTTLLEQILASHSQVHGAGELNDLRRITETVCMRETGQGYAWACDKLGADGVREIGINYLACLERHANGLPRVTDKMPANFLVAGLLHAAIPDAVIIHSKRSPLDTCTSCYHKLFAGHQPFSYDLEELGLHYRNYHNLMGHWHDVLPDGAMLDVKYEKLVASPEDEVRRVLDHAGLDWEDACMNFHKTRRPVRTASAMQVRKPLYSSSIGRWKLYEKHLGPLIEALGPELAY